MTNLIPITPASGTSALVPVYLGTIGGIPAPVVKGRELHTYLENGDKFADWISARVEKYGFLEKQDFESFSVKAEKPKGGRPSTEYHFCLDMAKELSMVENNAKGREARRYFIAMERRALESAGQVVPASHQETLTPSEQQTLKELVAHKVETLPTEQLGKAIPEIWSRVQRKFRVAKYSQLPRTQLTEAILYITAMELRGVPGPAPALERITSSQMHRLSQMIGVSSRYLHMTSSTEHALWYRLRLDYAVEKSIANLPAQYFDQALDTLAALDRIVFTVRHAEIKAEQRAIRQYIRGHAPFNAAAFEAEFEAIFDAELAQMMQARQKSLELLR